MKKLNIQDLIIEITRKCNIQCEHCLRGCMENIDIQSTYINDILKQCEYISNVTFTGGEPSLNANAIEMFLRLCQKRNINIGSFYIATNGIDIKENFILACLKMYIYCEEKDICNVQVSNDHYHAEQNDYNAELLEGLSFFNRKYQKEGETYTGINEGNYKEYYGYGRENEKCLFEIEENNISENELYLNCEGNLIAGCDWSYQSQKRKDLIICKSNEDILEGIKKYNKNLQYDLDRAEKIV